MRRNVGQDNQQILANFRQFTRSHVDQFISEKDRVYKLLGSSQQYSSGIFREGLIRRFLKDILPDSVSVNSGFIYGFEVEPNSKQMDIIIWDSSKYGPIYHTMEYVILPPESVIAIITVKSNMNRVDLEGGLENLSSVINLDFKFRLSRINKNKERQFQPIYKYFVAYSNSSKIETQGNILSEFYIKLLEDNQEFTNELVNALQNIDPMNPSSDIKSIVDAIFPKMLFCIDDKNASFVTGWGPPDDLFGNKVYGKDKVKRKPYIYNQQNNITTQLDKFVSDILSVVYAYLDTPGWSTSAAWADIHPTFGFRMGDADEIDTEICWPLFNESRNIYKKKERNLELPEGWV